LRNLLPVDIHVTSPIKAVIGGGEGIPLNVIAGHEVKFWIDYGREYEATLKLKYNPDDLEIVTLCDKASPTSELNLGVHWGLEYLHKECSIYAPYWIVNNTGKTLSYLVSFLNFIFLFLSLFLSSHSLIFAFFRILFIKRSLAAVDGRLAKLIHWSVASRR
jgi:hypothetical protein